MYTIRFSETTETDSIVYISSDESVVYVCTEEKQEQEDTNYFGDKSDSSADSSWSFQTPPDLTEKLKALYAGVGSMYLDENDEMALMEGAPSSTPKRLKDQNDQEDIETEKNDEGKNKCEMENN